MDITYKVSEKALAPVEVRAFLRKECGFSHGLWRRLKWNGRLLINNKEVRCTTAMAQAGDEIRCIIPEESSLVVTPMKLDIRYENEYLLVLNKPTGILVHPTGGDYSNTLGNGILHYYRETGQNLDFHPVHRLDSNTTAIAEYAYSAEWRQILSSQLSGHH